MIYYTRNRSNYTTESQKDFFDKIKTFVLKKLFLYKKSVKSSEHISSKFIIAKLFTGYRSSQQRRSIKKGVLKNFAKFTVKHLCQSLFFNKVVGLRPATLLKKRLWQRCFLVNFAKFLRTPFLENTSGRLLLRLLNSLPTVLAFHFLKLRSRPLI